MAAPSVEGDKYRSYLSGEGERNTQWRYGAPPNYDVVNQLFEEGRTKIWPPGSVEEKVQNLVKTWEMEMFHKTRFEDYKTVDPKKYRFSLNGREGITLEEKRKLGGGYNFLLQTSLPDKFRCYNPAEETVDSAQKVFTTAFPRGFALEILEVYSGPPVIVYKFRHWAFMEGPFKGHAPTGEMVEFYGMSIFELDEQSKIVRVEFFYDRGELLGRLVKGKVCEDSARRKGILLEELRNLGGGYNSLLQTSLPNKFRCYNPAEETVDSAHKAFTTAFPHGFTLEILQVYSGPPVIVYKFSHWAFMEGPFKGNTPTGEMVEFYGMCIFELDKHSKIVRVEFFYDRGELLGGLMKGKAGDDSASEMSSSCPFLKNTG